MLLRMPEQLLCSVLPAGEQRRLGANTGLSPLSPAAGQQVKWLSGTGVFWRRTMAGDCSGCSWAGDRQGEVAEPQLCQPTRTPWRGDLSPLVPTLSSPAVPPSQCKSSPRHQHSQLLSEAAPPAPAGCLYPWLRLFIHPRCKVKNPITYTRYQSNKQRHCPGELTKPLGPAGS